MGRCFEGGEKRRRVKGGEDLPRADLRRKQRQRYGSVLEAAAVRTGIFIRPGGLLRVYRTGWIRGMASIRANCRKIVCIGRNYAYVICSGRTLCG